MALAPGGKILATCGPDGVSLWGLASGKEIRWLGPRFMVAVQIAYAPDGTMAAVAERDGTVRLWNVETGKELHNSAGFSGALQQLRFLVDGKTLAASGIDNLQQSFRVHDAATGKVAGRLRSLDNQFISNPWSVAPDGKSIVCTNSDPMSGRETRRLSNEMRWGSGSGLAADGRTIAAIWGSRMLVVADLETGAELSRFSVEPNQMFGNVVVLSPDGRRAATSGIAGVFLWDVPSVTELWKGDGADRPTSQIAFTPDDKTVAYGVNNQVCVMEVISHQVRLQLDDPRGAKGLFIPNRALGFSPDSRVLAFATYQAEIVLYDVPTGKELGRSKGHRGGVTALTFSPEGGTLASGGTDGIIIVWDAASLVKKNRPALTAPIATELASLWQDLAGDAAKAHPLLWTLTFAPDKTVAVLKDKLKAVTPLDPKQIAKLINDLDDDDFKTRQQATETLGSLPAAETSLRKALANNPSPEKKRRLETALAKREAGASSELVREARALEVLEMLGTKEAKELLEQLAKGAADATLTRDCQAALDRLASRERKRPE